MSMKRGIVCASFYARLVRRDVLIGDPSTQRSFTRPQKKEPSTTSRYMRIASVHSDIFREITLATRAFNET